MSTYTLAWLVSDLDYREYETKNEPKNAIKHRIFAPKDDADQTSYALNLGVDVLKALENYFNVPYKLSKMDQTVVPGSTCDGMCIYLQKKKILKNF